jgi:hypothetical protein
VGRKATAPRGIAGYRGIAGQEPGCRGPNQNGIPVFCSRVRFKMRNTMINKILSFQYLLGRRIGRNKARFIAMSLERVFIALFGREAYEDKKIR